MSKPLQQSGFAGRLSKIFRNRVFDVDHILLFKKPIDTENKFRKIRPAGMNFHVATNADEIAPLARAYPERAHFFRDYISQGISACYATKDDEVLGYIFVTDKDFYDRHLWKNTVEVKPGEVFHFAAYVKPTSRGSIATIFLLQGLHHHFKSIGYSAALTTISDRNDPSWRACLKFGYHQEPMAWDIYKLFRSRWSRKAQVRSWVKLEG